MFGSKFDERLNKLLVSISSEFRVNLREWERIKPRSAHYVYHYTSHVCARQIIDSMCIRTSQARVRRFGTGVFLTTMSPSNSTAELLENNYQGNTKYRNNTQCAFALPKSDFSVVKVHDPRDPKRDIWRINTSVELSHTDFYLITR